MPRPCLHLDLAAVQLPQPISCWATVPFEGVFHFPQPRKFEDQVDPHFAPPFQLDSHSTGTLEPFLDYLNRVRARPRPEFVTLRFL